MWYCENIGHFNGKKSVVGRIDHAADYRLGNIEIQEDGDNVKERNARCGNPALAKRKKVLVFEYPEMRFVKITDSVKDAADYAGCFETSVSAVCRGKHHSVETGFTFRYHEELNAAIS